MIWDRTTSICHLQYGRVLREWPVIFFSLSLHLTLALLFLRIPVKVPWMMIFFFSKWSPALLQAWPKYFSFGWPILFANEGLYVLIGDEISLWYPKQLSPAPHLKGWYCSPVCLSDSLWLTSIERCWEYQCLYDTYLCCSGDVSIFPDIWKCWSICLGLVLSQLSPDINRASTILDNHWLTTPLDQLLLHIMIVVFSTLRQGLNCSLTAFILLMSSSSSSEVLATKVVSLVYLRLVIICPPTETWPSGLSTNRNLTLRFMVSHSVFGLSICLRIKFCLILGPGNSYIFLQHHMVSTSEQRAWIVSIIWSPPHWRTSIVMARTKDAALLT